MDKNQALTYYDRFLEDVEEQASDEVKKSYKAYREAFDEYLSAIQEDLFQQAYRYGYEWGVKDAKAHKSSVAG